MGEAHQIADEIGKSVALVCQRAIKSAGRIFGESNAALTTAGNAALSSGAARIEAYAQRVAWKEAEALRRDLDELRAENRRLLEALRALDPPPLQR